MAKQTEQMDIIKIDENLLERIQQTITECLPIAGKTAQTISQSVTIANGLNQMRHFFKNKDVEKLVTSMQDSKLGFLTDKPKGKKRWDSKVKAYVDVKPYTYEEITEAIIPMMLEGYRFTGNEINIIAGQGMPVKAGKHRRIIEYEGLEGFKHSVGTPQKDGGETGIAKMKCQAKWILDGKEYSIGYGDDICIIAVEYDKYAGLDKLIGLAESKLYSRVLTRILGKFVSEGEISTVIEPDEKPKNAESEEIKKRFEKQQAEESKPANETRYLNRLAEMVKDPKYNQAIQDIISDPNSGIDQGDLKTSNGANAKDVVETIEKVHGFLEAEKSESVDDHF